MTFSATHQAADTKSFLYVIAGVTAIAGFLYGYDTGIISGALMQISADFQLGSRMQELIASSILVGAVLGALGCGSISERIGRRRTIMVVAVIFCLGALASSNSPTPLLLSLSRVLLGLAVGGSSQVTPMYIAELAPPLSRGRLVLSFNLAIGVGILVANIVGVTLHAYWSWRWMIAVAIFPAIALLLLMLRLPESPRWLAEHVSLDRARHVLEQVRENPGEVDLEISEIRQIVAADRTGSWKILLQPWLRPAATAAFGVAAFTQLSGLETMIYYAPTILAGAGFGRSAALLTSLGVAVVFVLMTAIGRQIVDRVGRRRLTLLMVPGTVLSLLLLGTMFRLGMANNPRDAWLLVLSLLVYMVFNAGGIQVIGWLMGAEMFPLAIRARASSVHAATLWGSNLIITSTALSTVARFGAGGTMWIYAGLNFLCFLFVWKFVPETTGHSLEDIETHLRAGTFLTMTKKAELPASGI